MQRLPLFLSTSIAALSLGITIAPLGHTQTPPPPPATPPATQTGDKTFQNKAFSIQYPPTWIMRAEGPEFVVLHHRTASRAGGVLASYLAVTTIEVSPGQENLDQMAAMVGWMGAKEANTQKVQQDGREVLRIWARGGGNIGLDSERSAMTILHYGKDKSIIIRTYLEKGSNLTDAEIERIHASLRSVK
ncbi:MAG: hypothetical protein SFW36_22995 [Leptolyngbyaceae cyanobacterium bins.59]|nr:hypothetical protein [Leptolyngbyaceae cyanobacterium bins.59]